MRLKQLAARSAFVALASAVSLALPAGPLLAAAPAPAPAAFPQVALTVPIVQAFIASYPTVKAETAIVGKKYNLKPATAGTPDGGWGAWMAIPAAWAELNGVVAPYGYASFKAWLDTTISVSIAYNFAAGGPAMEAMVAQAQAAASNPKLTPAMRAQIQAGAGALAAMKPSPANLDAVKPFLGQLAPLLKP